MNFSEIVIVYLSLGAPVAVYRYLHHRRQQERNALAVSLLAFLLWPVALAATLASTSNDSKNDFAGYIYSDARTDRMVENILVLAKRDLVRTGRSQDFGVFKENVERYVSLSQAALEGDAIDIPMVH
ncbi:MAG TPA: hypothetical protein VK468_07855, partial [Pyrinomonadaceae bacterium]|nr:hypothetical protein [Pyrinomonadaceae bacterium]